VGVILLTGINLIELSSVSSTNDYAILLCDINKVEEGTFIWTGNQTQGKGQRGNKWEANSDECLAFSIIYFPNFLPPEKVHFLSIIAALSTRAFLANHLPALEVKIKWPNDIFVKDKKISGLLVENTFQGNRILRSIFGIGINVNQSKFPNYLVGAISLQQLIEKKTELKELVSIDLFQLFDHYYHELKSANYSHLMMEYNKFIWGLGEEKTLIKGNEKLPVTLLGVNDDGSLQIKDNLSGKQEKVFWPEGRITSST
jgi:BirA family transcriptional regulator, biotin operon repressor / biotin---[acetyl-CoA-carboxylase] ligase